MTLLLDSILTTSYIQQDRSIKPDLPGCLLSTCPQEKRSAAAQYQAHVVRQQEQARQSAWKVTQLAKADLQALKQRQEQQRQQAAAMNAQMTQWHA